MDNFDPYNVFLAIATNIPQRLDWFCGPGSHMRTSVELSSRCNSCYIYIYI